MRLPRGNKHRYGIAPAGQAGKDQILTVLKWMGCTMAVYRGPFQVKFQGGGNPQPRHGGKRRGSRSKRGGKKKRRAVVGAAPSEPRSRITETRLSRISYMTTRRLDWARQRSYQLARMLDAVERVKARRGPPGTWSIERQFALHKLHDLIREGCARWAQVSARASHEPLEFAKARLRVLLFTIRHGFDPLPMPRYRNPDASKLIELGPLFQHEVEQDIEEEVDEMSDDHSLWVYRALRNDPAGPSFVKCKGCKKAFRRGSAYPGMRCPSCWSKRGGRLLTKVEVSRIKPAF